MLAEVQNQVRQMIEKALPVFLEQHACRFNRDERTKFELALAEKAELYRVRQIIHSVLVRNLNVGGFESAPFWAMVDSINFLVDVETRRWPYQREQDHIRFLNWALQNLEAALDTAAELV